MKEQSKVVSYLQDLMPSYEFKETNTSGTSVLDGFMFEDNELKGIFEVKCRKGSLGKLFNYGSYMITQKKIEEGIYLSKLMAAPYFLFVKTIADDQTIAFRITDENGKAEFGYQVRKTQTKKTSIGGQTWRDNAFLPMDKCIRL